MPDRRITGIPDRPAQEPLLVFEAAGTPVEQGQEHLLNHVLRRLAVREDHQGITEQRCPECVVEACSLGLRRHPSDYRRLTKAILSTGRKHPRRAVVPSWPSCSAVARYAI